MKFDGYIIVLNDKEQLHVISNEHGIELSAIDPSLEDGGVTAFIGLSTDQAEMLYRALGELIKLT